MATREQLTKLLDHLTTAPHDDAVRSAADAALTEVSDDNVLAEVMQDFVVELPVAEAIERRLVALGSSNPLAWLRVGQALAHHVDTEEKRDHVMVVVRQILKQDPEDRGALRLGIMLWAAPSPNPPRAELMEWTERYVALESQSEVALSLRAKVLLTLNGDDAAIRFLEERLQRQPGNSELAMHLQELLGRIRAGQDVLQQWP